MIDWTFELLFQPDIVKISLDSEEVERLRRTADVEAASKPVEHRAVYDSARTVSRQLNLRRGLLEAALSGSAPALQPCKQGASE